jgi:IS4 transposase
MILREVFDRFAKDRPIAVMVRALLENALQPAALDALFTRLSQKQYARELLFSQLVDLMSLVVTGVHPSTHAAYQRQKDRLKVSPTALYDKLQGVEPQVSAALVQETAQRLVAVIQEVDGALPPLLPGYRLRILDGNCLASTEHRLQVLRGTSAGALPGKSLVVLDPALMLAVAVYPCEDGHAQERALLGPVLNSVQPGELWIEDRNFCTLGFVNGVARRGACFLVREHASNTPWEAVTGLAFAGRQDGAEVWEQAVRIADPDTGGSRVIRRIEVRLAQPTRDGERVIALLTNLPSADADALTVATLYRKRWKIENLFQTLATELESEQTSLGYPKAGLFSCCVALVAYNVIATVKAALRAAQGHDKVEAEVSSYYLINEVKETYGGMMVALPAEQWEPYRDMTPKALAQVLKKIAAAADLSFYRLHRRGPKKPQPPRTRPKNQPHVSTARLLAAQKKKAKKRGDSKIAP